jgi:transposase
VEKTPSIRERAQVVGSKILAKLLESKIYISIRDCFLGTAVQTTIVFLIVDNLSTHKSDKVIQWVEKNSSCIRLFFLPKYSPDLNPDEYLNNDVKSNAVGRRRARDKKELQSNESAYLRSTQKHPSVIKSFFFERHVRYAAMQGLKLFHGLVNNVFRNHVAI